MTFGSEIMQVGEEKREPNRPNANNNEQEIISDTISICQQTTTDNMEETWNDK